MSPPFMFRTALCYLLLVLARPAPLHAESILEAPTPATEQLSALSESYTPEGDLIGSATPYTVKASDTFYDIARSQDLGYVEMALANPGVDPWIPGEGHTLTLPTHFILPEGNREGVVINLAEQRMYFFPQSSGDVYTFPISVGSEGWETPTGETRIVRKREHPTWRPPASIREQKPDLPEAVPPGPENPLGNHALNLGWTNIVIHGTNRPWGLGQRVSHGCIRMYPEDIAWLFQQVEVGTPVRVMDSPVKLGWSNNELYIEVHPPQWLADRIAARQSVTPLLAEDVHRHVVDAAGLQTRRINWYAIDRAMIARSGLPVRITTP